jgi:hypothetical protein
MAADQLTAASVLQSFANLRELNAGRQNHRQQISGN